MKLNGKVQCPCCKSTNVHPWLLKQANIWDDKTHQQQIDAFKDRVRISTSCDNIIYNYRCDECDTHFFAMVTIEASVKDVYVGGELYEVEGLKYFEADKLKQETTPKGKSINYSIPCGETEYQCIQPDVAVEINDFFAGYDNILVKRYLKENNKPEYINESLCGVGITTNNVIHKIDDNGRQDHIGAIHLHFGVNGFYAIEPDDTINIHNNILTVYGIEDGVETKLEFIILDGQE